MACAYPDPADNSAVEIFHYEKGNSTIILWHLEHFTTCADIDYGFSPLFKVNVRSPRSWSFEMCFKTEAVEERRFYGICLQPIVVIPDDIRITCRFHIVETNCELYSAEPCFLRVTKLTGHVVFGHLIEKELLSQNESRFLHHNTLLIRCELSVESSRVQPRGFPSVEDYRVFSSNDFVCNMMGEFYRKRKYSNLTWAFNSNMENVHKSILAARSQKFSDDLTRRIDLQPDVQTFDIDDDVGLALLLYIYTGNPHEIKCIPLGLNKEAEKYGLPLLTYFADPYTMTFRSRIKVQELNIALNIKNFNIVTAQKRNSILFDYEIFEIGSKWSLLLGFQGKDINIRLSKLSCFDIPMTVELKIHVMENNQCVLLNTQKFHSVSDSKETYSFSTSTSCLQNLLPDNHLKLKIAMKVSYHCIQDHGKKYEMTFSSELCGAEQKVPLDFERLKSDVLNMYESEIFPDLILESANGQVFVHGFIAAYHSPFIASVLDQSGRADIGEPLQLQRICMPDVAQWALVAIARFMYTGELGDVTLEKSIAFLHAAKKYKMTHLRNVILNFLRRNLNGHTCRDIHCIASSFDEEELEAEAFQLICSQLNTTPRLVSFWLRNREREGEPELSARPSSQHLESIRNRQATSRHREPIRSRQFHMKEKKEHKSKLKRKIQIADEKNRYLAETKRSVEKSKSKGKKGNGSFGGIGNCVQCLPPFRKKQSDEKEFDKEVTKRDDKTYQNMGKGSLSERLKIKARKEHETSVNFKGQDVKDIKNRSRLYEHKKKLNIRLKGKKSENIREIQLVITGRNLDVSPRLSIGHQSLIASPIQVPQEAGSNQPPCVDTNTGLRPRQSEDGGRQESGDKGQKAKYRSPRHRGRIEGRVLEDIESRPLFIVDNATRVLSDSHPNVGDQGPTVNSPLAAQDKELSIPPIPTTYDIPPILSPERARYFQLESPLVSNRPDAMYQDLAAPSTPSTDDNNSLLSNGRTPVAKDQGTSLPDVVYQDRTVPPIPCTDDTIPMPSPRRTFVAEDLEIPRSDAVCKDLVVSPLPSSDDIIPTPSQRYTPISEGQLIPQLDAVSQGNDVPPLPSTDDAVPMLSPEPTLSFGRLGPMFTPRPGEIYKDLTVPPRPSMDNIPTLSSTRNRADLTSFFSPRPDLMHQGQAVPTHQSTDDTMLSSERSLVEDKQIPRPDDLDEDLAVSPIPGTDDIIPMLSSERPYITEDQEIPRTSEVNQDLGVPPLPSTDDTIPILSPRPTDISENQSPGFIADSVHKESSGTEESP